MKLKFDFQNGETLFTHNQVGLPPSHMTPAERVWASWVFYRTLDVTPRSGVLYCGAYPDVQPMPDMQVARFRYDSVGQVGLTYVGSNTKTHVESVGDHTRSVANLIRLMTFEYPELFTRNHAKPRGGAYDSEVILARDRLTLLMQYHDIAEAFTGDSPDDGSRDEKAKLAEELVVCRKVMDYLGPVEVYEQLLKDLVNFQYPTTARLYEGWMPYDGELIQLARLADKFDSILTAFKDEAEGHPATSRYRKEVFDVLSERDEGFVTLCGRPEIADTWMAQILTGYYDYFGFSKMCEIVYAAAMDVRGEWYAWWDEVCQREGIVLDGFDPKTSGKAPARIVGAKTPAVGAGAALVGNTGAEMQNKL